MNSEQILFKTKTEIFENYEEIMSKIHLFLLENKNVYDPIVKSYLFMDYICAIIHDILSNIQFLYDSYISLNKSILKMLYRIFLNYLEKTKNLILTDKTYYNTDPFLDIFRKIFKLKAIYMTEIMNSDKHSENDDSSSKKEFDYIDNSKYKPDDPRIVESLSSDKLRVLNDYCRSSDRVRTYQDCISSEKLYTIAEQKQYRISDKTVQNKDFDFGIYSNFGKFLLNVLTELIPIDISIDIEGEENLKNNLPPIFKTKSKRLSSLRLKKQIFFTTEIDKSIANFIRWKSTDYRAILWNENTRHICRLCDKVYKMQEFIIHLNGCKNKESHKRKLLQYKQTLTNSMVKLVQLSNNENDTNKGKENIFSLNSKFSNYFFQQISHIKVS